ncbi:hypothetical protein SAMN05428939_7579 [Streptomyces sp. TLI_105]|nr:hypothetical protein SAMN05428939_7579 [Streptomyces sp. TLI_105]
MSAALRAEASVWEKEMPDGVQRAQDLQSMVRGARHRLIA